MAEEAKFVLNYENEYFIDTTPNTETETWAPLSAGIMNVSWSGNEVIDQTQYYDGQGLASSEVTGGQLVASVSGHRKVGDKAQDYVFGKMITYGAERKTRFKWNRNDGKTITAPATICNIADSAGDAGAKDEISFEIHLNGKPTIADTPEG